MPPAGCARILQGNLPLMRLKSSAANDKNDNRFVVCYVKGYAVWRQNMHYIVFDLEWNQAAGKIGHEGGLPFEIVEIGAVKLNRRMQIIDRFEEVIKPRIYPHMHFMTTKISITASIFRR